MNPGGISRLKLHRRRWRSAVAWIPVVIALTLTCTGNQSRNYSLGLALGEGHALGDILAGRQSVSEGVHSAAAAQALAERHGLDLPITAAVDAILNQGAAIEAAIEGLLARPFKSENV